MSSLAYQPQKLHTTRTLSTFDSSPDWSALTPSQNSCWVVEWMLLKSFPSNEDSTDVSSAGRGCSRNNSLYGKGRSSATNSSRVSHRNIEGILERAAHTGQRLWVWMTALVPEVMHPSSALVVFPPFLRSLSLNWQLTAVDSIKLRGVNCTAKRDLHTLKWNVWIATWHYF